MSIAGLAATSFLSGVFSTNQSSRFVPVAQELQQLGQDLKSGNLPAAQSDFATLRQDAQPSLDAVLHHRHPRFQEAAASQGQTAEVFRQLGQELQSGNIAAAQQTYAALLRDFQQSGATGVAGSDSGRVTGGISVSA